ncbi:MAG: carboxypeptidase regulatory-like domain-containing protein [Bacteroidota bacterium]
MMRRGALLAVLGFVFTVGVLAQEKGVIKGTVTDEASGQPITLPHTWGMVIQIYPSPIEQPTEWIQVPVDGEGKYEAKVEAGTYVLRIQPPYSSVRQYLPEWYNDTDSANATPIPVSAGEIFSANIALGTTLPGGPTGKIIGVVIDEVTKEPIENVPIIFYGADSMKCIPHVAFTGSDGKYEAVLATGTYLVKAHPISWPLWESGYLPEWYDGVQDVEDATPVDVGEGSEVAADFELGKKEPPTPAYITGTVTDEGGSPIDSAVVVITKTIQEMNHIDAESGPIPGPLDNGLHVEGLGHVQGGVWKGMTDAEGKYKAEVADGNAYLAMAYKKGYAVEFYDNQTNPLLAEVIEVNGDVGGIDFSLELYTAPSNSISGLVRDESAVGVKSRIVLIPTDYGIMHHSVRFGYTDDKGAYSIENVNEAKYLVLAIPFSDYAPAFYKEGEYGVIHWKDADIVTVSGNVNGIDIGVVPLGSMGVVSVTGRVVDGQGSPLEGVNVFAMSSAEEVLGYGLTSANGDYAIEGLPVGTFALVADREGYDPAQTSVTVPSGTYSVGNVGMTMKSSGPVTGTETESVPTSYRLDQNYPNPFNPATTISFEMPATGAARLTVFNLLGEEVATLVDGLLQAGRHSAVWGGTDFAGRPVSSGLYFYQLTVANESGQPEFSRILKMMLLK